VRLAQRIKLEVVVRTTRLIFALFVVLVGSLPARESVCLKSGFCLAAESHVISDGMLVVQSGHGTLQFPLDQVEEISTLPAALEARKLESDHATLTPDPKAKPSNAGASSEQLLMLAALREGLEPDFVRSVALVESNLRQNAVSPKGAMGLMQLMPFTAGELGVNATLADQNALGGATFLRQLLIKYKGDSVLALAAYNAGPAAVDRYKGVPPYSETRRYVVRVLREYERQRQSQMPKIIQAAKGSPAELPSGTEGSALQRQ
jgi:hypothetical protein